MKFIVYAKALFHIMYATDTDTPQDAVAQVQAGEATSLGDPVLVSVLPPDEWVVEPALIANAIDALSGAVAGLFQYIFATGGRDYNDPRLVAAREAVELTQQAVEQSKQVAEALKENG